MCSPHGLRLYQKQMDIIKAGKALEIRRFRHVKPGSCETLETGFQTKSETGFTSGETHLNRVHFAPHLALEGFFFCLEAGSKVLQYGLTAR